ncbi:hypothetical protein ACFLQ6_01815 [Thermoproteota archaeon]
MPRFPLLLLSILLISPLVTGYLLNVPSIDQVTAQPGSWPSSSDWISLDTDPDEPGCDDDRNVIETFYFIDTGFLYLRMETVNDAGWEGSGATRDARFKWWFDTVGQDASIFGTSVANAEFQIILEDRFNNGGGVKGESTPPDGLGELTLIDDFEHDQFTPRWNNPAASPVEYVQNTPGTTQGTDSGGASTLWYRVLGTGSLAPSGPQSSMSDPNIGYSISGEFVDMYVSLAALGNPAKICLIWATDIHNVNLDQAPNCDAPEETTCKPDGGIPIIDINVDKTLQTPQDGNADPGELVAFQVNITNTGLSTLVLVPLNYSYDASKLVYTSATPTPNHVHIHTGEEPFNGHLRWDNLTDPAPNGVGSTLAPGDSILVNTTFLVKFDATPGTTLDIADVFEAIDNFDHSANDKDNATLTINTPPPAGDVSVNKTRTQPQNGITSVNGIVLFTINVTNTGSSNLNTVQLIEGFNSTALSFNSATPTEDSQTPLGILTWNDLTGAGSLTVGSSIIVTLSFTANAPTGPSPTLDTVGVNADDASAVDFDSVTILDPDIDVVKSLIQPSGGTAFIGDTVVYIIEITNTGGVPLVFIPLVDAYNSSVLEFVSATPTPNDTTPLGTLTWDDLTGIGSLDVGEEIVVTVTFKAIGPTCPLANTCTINLAVSENAEDENTNQVTDGDPSSLTVGFPPVTLPIEAPVGGYAVPLNKFDILAPYLVLVGLIGLLSAIYYFRKRSRV